MAQLFGDWWRAQEDRAFLTSNGADGEEASQSVEGQTATHPPHSLSARLFLPTEKSFLGESGEAVNSQTHSTSGRLRKSSAFLITLHSLIQVHRKVFLIPISSWY